MIDYGLSDRRSRSITLRAVDEENWRQVADIAPRDEQREFAPALAARYLLLSTLESNWNSLAVYAEEHVVGHVMWGVDDDDSHWIGGVLIDAAHQGTGIGSAAMHLLIRWLAERPECDVIRLSYHPNNTVAARLYEHLGFGPNGDFDGDEIVVERRLTEELPGR